MNLLRFPFRSLKTTRRRPGARRRCILHVGSPKTATSSIQSLLRSSRKRFLQDGILIPESGQTSSGSHRYLAFSLAGMPVPPEAASADQKLAREISQSDAECVLISSEFLWSILTHKKRSERLLGTLRSLDLDITIVLYVRNHPQYFNSVYQHDANFRRNCEFTAFVSRARRHRDKYTYSRWIEFAETHGVALVARPFSQEVRRGGVIEDFLTTVGVSSASRYDTGVELRRSIGPFTVACARALMGRIGDPKKLTEEQRYECRRALRAELRRRKIVDHGYCGLTSALAAQIEQEFAEDTSRFAHIAWATSWAEMFSGDVAARFEPNDYSLTGVPAERRALLAETIDSLEPRIDAMLGEPWNF